jgi:hypothetical protein
MAAFQHRPFSSPIPSHFSYSRKNMPAPLSPPYTPFSAQSPFSSSSSSNSYHDGNSPIESHFDSLPSPVEAVNSDVAVFSAGSISVQMFPSQGDVAASYPSDFDYGMMALASDFKKQVCLPFLCRLPPNAYLSLQPTGSSSAAQQCVLEAHGPCVHPASGSSSASQPKHAPISCMSIFSNPSRPVPSQTTVSTGSSPSYPCTAISHAPTYTHRRHVRRRPRRLEPAPASCPHPESPKVRSAFVSPRRYQSLTCSKFSTPYSSSTPESRPTSRSKQGPLVFDGGMATFPAASVHPHPHMEVQSHYFDVGNSVSQHNPDQNGASLQARRQYQHHQSAQQFYSMPQIPRLPFSHPHPQPFVTVHPAEVSPLEPRPSDSPLSYSKIPATAINSDGEPGNYMCGSEMPAAEDIKGSLGMGLGVDLTMTPSVMQANWNGERKMVDTDLGDIDAEGEEVCPSDVEQPFNNSLSARPSIKSAPADEAEDEVLFDDTDVSRLSEESSTDSDDSEFIPGSRQRQRRSQATMSTSYPTYGQLEGRSLRTRSGTRYTPYPNDYSSDRTSDYMDVYHESGQSTRQKRLLHAPGGDLSDEYLNFTTLSASASSITRRRPRPSNTLPVPIPVPNLTKKSRGRRVPTVTSLEDLRSASSGAGRKRQTIGKGARMYLCEVEGCGKCFARGEHLKRHVRSIHTHEKRELLFFLSL